MKIIVKLLFCYALIATAAVWWGVGRSREVRRLENNQTVLCDSLHRYRTRLGTEAASVAALQLQCSEFARLRAEDAATIKSLGLRLRRLESLATTAVRTTAEIRTVIRDTVILRDTLHGRFRWSDGWTTVEGHAEGDSLVCSAVTVDTLRQVVHRVPRKFLFIRFGTKAIRQEITASNPHSRIIFAEYVELTKDGRRRAKRR